MVLINGVDIIQRKFGGKTYTLEESSGSRESCMIRANHLYKAGFSYRVIKQKDSRKVSGYKYLLYVSDKKRRK